MDMEKSNLTLQEAITAMDPPDQKTFGAFAEALQRQIDYHIWKNTGITAGELLSSTRDRKGWNLAHLATRASPELGIHIIRFITLHCRPPHHNSWMLRNLDTKSHGPRRNANLRYQILNARICNNNENDTTGAGQESGGGGNGNGGGGGGGGGRRYGKGNTPLHLAVKNRCHPAFLEVLLQAGADISIPCPISTGRRGKDGKGEQESVAHIAVRKENRFALELLCRYSQGRVLDLRNHRGETPRMLLASSARVHQDENENGNEYEDGNEDEGIKRVFKWWALVTTASAELETRG